MTTKKKTTKRKRNVNQLNDDKPVTKRDLKANNPTITGLIGERVKPFMPILGFIVALGTAAGTLAGAWIYFGGSWLVSDKTLAVHLNEVKTNITKTKEEFANISNSNKEEVKKDVFDVKKQIETLARKADRSALANLETQQRTLFTQRQSLTGQLAVIEERIRRDPSDGLAQQRKLELEGFIRATESDFERLRQQIERAKNGGE